MQQIKIKLLKEVLKEIEKKTLQPSKRAKKYAEARDLIEKHFWELNQIINKKYDKK